jgi:hypothetical protein
VNKITSDFPHFLIIFEKSLQAEPVIMATTSVPQKVILALTNPRLKNKSGDYLDIEFVGWGIKIL